MVENYRTGSLTRSGLDEPAVRAPNPGVIYASITGFGSGAGADELRLPRAGGRRPDEHPRSTDGEPSKVGVAMMDLLAAGSAPAEFEPVPPPAPPALDQHGDELRAWLTSRP